MVCLCHTCSPTHKFNSMECMFCHKGLEGEGKLKSSHGARVCKSCMAGALKVLEEAIRKEKVNE